MGFYSNLSDAGLICSALMDCGTERLPPLCCVICEVLCVCVCEHFRGELGSIL